MTISDFIAIHSPFRGRAHPRGFALIEIPATTRIVKIPDGYRMYATNGIGGRRELFDGSPIRRTDVFSIENGGAGDRDLICRVANPEEHEQRQAAWAARRVDARITTAPLPLGRLEVSADGKRHDYDATGQTIEQTAEGISALLNGDPSAATGETLDALASMTGTVR